MTCAVDNKIEVRADLPRKANVGSVLKCWLQKYRSRQLLATLDRRQLKDIGITREEALQEIRKPFWR